MLQRAGAGEIALLCDVSDQEDGHVVLFGQIDQRVRACPDLTHASGEPVRRGVTDRLDRVDHQDRRSFGSRALHNVPEAPARHVGEGRSVDPHPQRPRGHLAAGFLPGREQAGVPGSGEGRRQLEEKGRLAGTGRPRQEDHRSRDEPATEDAIDAGPSRLDPVLLRIRSKPENHWSGSGRGRGAGPGRMLVHRAPAPARGAPPRPLRRGPPTARAHEHPFQLAHGGTVATGSDTA